MLYERKKTTPLTVTATALWRATPHMTKNFTSEQEMQHIIDYDIQIPLSHLDRTQ